jgi:hypothetical protein
MADKIATHLEQQGFEDQESYDVFDQLLRKYADGLSVSTKAPSKHQTGQRATNA